MTGAVSCGWLAAAEGAAHLCLSRALDYGASLDDAVKLEAAVLVDGRHDQAGDVGGFVSGLHARRRGVELHGSSVDGDGDRGGGGRR